MNRIEELVLEAQRVKDVIDTTNAFIENPEPVSTLGSNLINSIKRDSSHYAAMLVPKIQKAWSSGRFDEIVVGTLGLGAVCAGAFGIDLVRNSYSVAKAKKVLLAYYGELAVKENLLIEEQQKLIETICTEKQTQVEELQQLKERLISIKNQLVAISEVQKKKTV